MIAFHCFFGGFLPFSAISVELYYIFATVWGREQYTLYGVLLLVFFIVLLVSACISVALTYFQVRSFCNSFYKIMSASYRLKIIVGGGEVFSPLDQLDFLSFSTLVSIISSVQICLGLLKR